MTKRFKKSISLFIVIVLFASVCIFEMPAKVYANDALSPTALATDVSQVITYNSNGGSGTMADQIVAIGARVALSSNVFSKTGCNFAGWNTAANGKGASYSSGQEIIMPAGGLTLYAVWKPAGDPMISLKLITYNSNGGSGTMADQLIGDGVNVTLQANAFTRPGYIFGGWATSPNGTVSYMNRQTVAVPAGGLTLYAVWMYQSRTITYYANCGTGTMSSQTAGAGESITLIPNTYTRPGYFFRGWRAGAKPSESYYPDGAKITMPAGGLTLYAWWVPTYTLIFNSNDGSGKIVTRSGVTYDGNISIWINPFTRPGCNFEGWATSPAGRAIYSEMQVIHMSPGEQRTLYAVWRGYSQVIIYDSNGGSGTMANQISETGAKATLRNNAFTKAGHTFVGWATSPNGSIIYSNGQTITMPACGLTLYAVWKVTAYTLTLNVNGGSTASPTISTILYYGGTYGSLPAPSRNGYTFTGWFTAPTGGTKVTSSTRVTVSANQTLYAHWAKAQ